MFNYSYEDLELMTCTELRQICSDMGISGVSKTIKEDLINIILDNQDISEESEQEDSCCGECAEGTSEPEKLISPFNMSLTSLVRDENAPDGKKMTTLVRISSGSSSDYFNFVGKSISDIIGTCKEIFNIDISATVLVNGDPVGLNYVLKAGDIVEFLKPSGEKSN
jgi:hypothetical protein